MPVGAILLELLADDRPRGRRRCASSCRAASTESLRHTNLSRTAAGQDLSTPQKSGRRYFPQSTASTFSFSAPPPPAASYSAEKALGSRHPSSTRVPQSRDHLGMNMMAKTENPPSPRHKVYVKPPKRRPSPPLPPPRAHSQRRQERDHLTMGSLAPMFEYPRKEKVPDPPLLLKRRTTGIRMFKVIPGEKPAPVRRGVKMVNPPEIHSFECRENEVKPFVPRSSSARANKSHFSLAHSDELLPRETFRRTKSVASQRSHSVDIIAWRGVPSASAVSTPRYSRSSSYTPQPRSFNIITNCPC